MTRTLLARKLAWIAYLVSIGPTLLFGARAVGGVAVSICGPLANELGVQETAGIALGWIGGSFLALTLIPALAAGLGYALGWFIALELDLPRGGPDGKDLSLRSLLGVAPMWLIAFAPVSFILLPCYGWVYAMNRKLARSHLRAFWTLRAAGAVFMAAQFWLGYSWVPLLTGREVVAGWVFVSTSLIVLRLLGSRRAPIWLVATALLAAVFTPFPMPFGYRLAIFAIHLGAFLLPWLVLRDAFLRETSPLLVTAFLAFFLYWARMGQMASLPSTERLSGPVVSDVFRGYGGPIGSGGYFLTQPCPGWPLLAGGRERANGLVVFSEAGGPPLQRFPVVAADNVAPDCAAGVAFVADYANGRFFRLSLPSAAGEPPGGEGPLSLDPLPVDCAIHGPWLLRLDGTKERLHVLDEENRILSVSLADGTCRVEATGTKVFDFDLSKDRGELYLADQARIRVVSIDNGEERASLDLPGAQRWILPSSQRARVLVAPGGEIYSIYFNTGTVARIGRDPLSIEAATRLDKGLRLLVWDEPRSVLYAGNYVTGELTALDGTDLRVLARCHVGRRMRGASLTPGGDALTLTSVAGGIRVDLRRLLGEREGRSPSTPPGGDRKRG